MVILNQRHLNRVMRDYIQFWNEWQPHQGLEQQISKDSLMHIDCGHIQRLDILGGLIHEDYRDTA